MLWYNTVLESLSNGYPRPRLSFKRQKFISFVMIDDTTSRQINALSIEYDTVASYYDSISLPIFSDISITDRQVYDLRLGKSYGAWNQKPAAE